MKVYLAGPMTHIKQFNFPAFDAVAADLRDDTFGPGSFEVISPAELDDPAARAAAMSSEDGDPEEYARLTGLTWGDFLSRDVKLIADGGFDAIICLEGWENSRGARLETFVGFLNKVEIFEIVGLEELPDGDRIEYTFDTIPTEKLARAWAQLERGTILDR